MALGGRRSRLRSWRGPAEWRVVSRSAERAGSRRWRQQNYRDRAIRLGLVLAELRRALHLGGEQAITLLTARLARDNRDGVGADLDLDVRVGLEVVVPVRVRGCSGLRGEHHVAVPVTVVDQRVYAILARPGANVMQQ